MNEWFKSVWFLLERVVKSLDGCGVIRNNKIYKGVSS